MFPRETTILDLREAEVKVIREGEGSVEELT